MQNQEIKNQYYTKFIDKKTLKLDLERASLELIDCFSGLVVLDKKMISYSMSDGYEFINLIATRNDWPEYIRKIYLQCYFVSEQITKGSGCISAYFLAKRFLNFKLNEPEAYSEFVEYSEYQQAKNAVGSTVDQRIKEFVFKVIDTSGINGNIIIENTDKNFPMIEIGSGHSFDVGFDLSFLTNKEKRQESKIIIYDGAVVDVGQIDRIFSECSEKKMTCIIVARSFGNDVMSTINVNHKRKTLDILPVVVNDKIEHVNMMNDVATATGAMIINAESGIRLSNISINDMTTIDNVLITKGKISFDAKLSQANAVSKKINKILDRINRAVFDEKMSYQDVSKVFVPRIMALSSNSVNVWVPGNRDFLLHVRKNFDFSIKMLSAFSNSGMIKSTNIFKDGNKLPDFLPANFIDASIIASSKVYFAISNSGGCVAIQ